MTRLARLRPPRPLIAWGVPFVLLGSYAMVRGPVATPDTAAYSMWADRLIASGFDVPAVLRAHGSALAATYLLFVTLVAGCKLLVGEWWLYALVAINVVAQASVALLLTRVAARATGSGAASWFALGAFLACFELWQWVPYALSDSSFLLLACLVFAMEARRLVNSRGRWAPVFAASAAASLYRPTGFLMVGVTAWSFGLARTTGRRGAALALLGVAAIAGALVFGWLMQDPARWPFPFASTEVASVAGGYAQGQVVWDRPGTYHAAPGALADYWAITADRLFHFFAPAAADFDVAHTAVQLGFFVPVYLLAGGFVVALLRGRSGLSKPQTDLFYAAIGAIAAYAVFHGLVQVDYDWRYRLPIMPHLILLASGGVAVLVRRVAT